MGPVNPGPGRRGSPRGGVFGAAPHDESYSEGPKKHRRAGPPSPMKTIVAGNMAPVDAKAIYEEEFRRASDQDEDRASFRIRPFIAGS